MNPRRSDCATQQPHPYCRSMESSEQLSRPVLPLRDIVVFPQMIVPLFVGRDKSVKALEAVMQTDKSIFLLAPIITFTVALIVWAVIPFGAGVVLAVGWSTCGGSKPSRVPSTFFSRRIRKIAIPARTIS